MKSTQRFSQSWSASYKNENFLNQNTCVKISLASFPLITSHKNEERKVLPAVFCACYILSRVQAVTHMHCTYCMPLLLRKGDTGHIPVYIHSSNQSKMFCSDSCKCNDVFISYKYCIFLKQYFDWMVILSKFLT